MKKRDYKEQERQRRYYFFDYLFWLGEMAQWHYKGEPRRPDGESMLMLCIMIFIYEPIFCTTAHFLFGSTAFGWFTVAMIVGIVVVHHCVSRRNSPLSIEWSDIPVFTKGSGRAAL